VEDLSSAEVSCRVSRRRMATCDSRRTVSTIRIFSAAYFVYNIGGYGISLRSIESGEQQAEA